MRELLRRDNSSGLAAQASNSAEMRAAPRFTVLIRAAKLISPQGEFLCVIRDVSESGLSARIFHTLPDCGAMMIELQNGDQYEADMVWQEEDRAGFRFRSPVNVARVVEVPSRYSKRAIRLNLEAEAEIIASLQIMPVTIQDISQQGAKVEAPQHFSIDQRVKLRAEGLREIEAKVRWRRGGQCGLIFEETFQFGELARIVCDLQRRDITP